MRISTSQLFAQGVSGVLRKQSSTAQMLEKLSSGKQVETAADDPVAAIGIDRLKQQNALADQFLKNIDYATTRLGLAESKLGLAETAAMAFRDKILQAVNGTLGDAQRQMLADDMQGTLDELTSIANSQDEAGHFIFAGFNNENQPFETNAAGTVTYLGDSGERQAAIAGAVVLSTNIPGDKAFMLASNGQGEYAATYHAGQQGDFYLQRTEIMNPALATGSDYRLDFLDDGGGGITLEVRDASNTLISTVTNFDSVNPINFAGLELQLSGSVAAGDSVDITPRSHVSIFDTFSQAIALLASDNVNTAAGQAELAQILVNTDAGLNQLSIARGEAGNSLKRLENYSARHEEELVVNSGALSMLEDLDYAAAISEFEKQQLALNAVANVFGQVGSVSLFDYLR